jgi:hypothetical protein
MEIWERYSDYSHCVEFSGATGLARLELGVAIHIGLHDRKTVGPPK